MMEILICKIQLLFLAKFLPASVLGVCTATRADNSGGESGMITNQMGSITDQKPVIVIEEVTVFGHNLLKILANFDFVRYLY
jgi:hypothetical protein